MMGAMAKQRGAILHATDEHFCIDNGIMIAHAGLLMYQADQGLSVAVEQATCSQRYRTDQVPVVWREGRKN